MSNGKIEVIPAVLEQTWEGIQDKVKRIKPYAPMIQLDVMDGVFVPNVTFNDTQKIKTLDINLELHLMIEKPDLAIQRWFLPNVKRIIVHYEAAGNLQHIVKQIHDAGIEAGVAINPETSTFDLRDIINNIEMVLVMGVNPGFSGQSFQYDVLEKIKELKKERSELLVGVDGGVSDATSKKIIEAGADMLSTASYIWNAKDPQQAIDRLKGSH
ncbi:MAG: ribulose-phosphate 3-epimerase [Candidatus Kerfeldbacteria bacterium]